MNTVANLQKISPKRFPSAQVLLTWVLFAFPFVLYIGQVLKYTLNIPYWDDYYLVLQFMNNFIQAATLKAGIWQIFLPHNEHRMVFEKLIILAQYALSGKINFQYLNYFGNLGWLLSVVFVAYLWKDKKLESAIDILPIPYLMLSFVNSESMIWASSSLPFYWSIFFSLLFLYFLARNSLIPAGVALGLAVFSLGGGLVLLPLAWAFLFFKKRYKELIIFAIFSLVLLGLYFFEYKLVDTASNALHQSVNIQLYFSYFLTFLGAPLEELTFIPGLAIVSGGAGVILLVALWVKDRKDEFTWLIVGFVLLIALEATALRSQFGIGQALSSRYMIYPLLFWCSLLFLSAKTLLPQFRFRYPLFALIAVLLFGRCIAVSQELSTFEILRAQRSSSIRAFQYGNSYLLLVSDQAIGRSILTTARQLGVYDFKSVAIPLRPFVWHKASDSLPESPLEISIDWFDNNRISGWAYLPGLNSKDSQTLVLLDNGAETYAMNTYRGPRRDVSALYQFSGFEGYLYANDIPRGVYKVGILVTNAGQQGVYWLDNVIQYP